VRRRLTLRARATASARAGTHSGLAAELARFGAVRDARIALAARRRDDELSNVRAIAACDEKMADDTFRERADEMRDRLADIVYSKYGKPNPSIPPLAEDVAPPRRERKRAPLYQAPWLAAMQRRRLLPSVQVRYGLSEAEVEEDLEFLLQEAEKAKHARELEARSADDADDDEPLDVSYDKQHNALMYGEQTLERWSAVLVTDRSADHASGLHGDWCITAIGPLEVTLRNVEGTRTKVRSSARAQCARLSGIDDHALGGGGGGPRLGGRRIDAHAPHRAMSCRGRCAPQVSLAALRSRRLAFTPLGVEP